MKFIIAFLFLLTINIVTAEEDDDPNKPIDLDKLCETVDGVVGCSTDCSSQQVCINGELKEVKCPKNSFLKPTYCKSGTFKCETEKECSNENTFRCPGRGTFPHLFDCHKLFMCENKGDDGVLKTCPQSKKYEAGSGTCSGIMCYNFSPLLGGRCWGKHNQIISHPANDRLFIHCSSAGPTLGSCAEGYALNTKTYQCEFSCPKSGLYIDSMDKKCYYKCTWSLFKYNFVRQCCEAGEVFNDKLKMCGPDVTRKLQKK